MTRILRAIVVLAAAAAALGEEPIPASLENMPRWKPLVSAWLMV